ncbi:MAG: ADP-glyceromanno-heptose 6-epimerase [Bacteroidetes bacterium HGW-Bacteroidetes-21]|nr:MAG: ADP-glyceromanno-heptose 6-epimerase [Bacteroidetes bacterium HGW-Bacteroidetes-21]
MKVLVTGGAGYVGTELIKLLNKDDQVESVIVYDNLSRNNYNLFLHSGISRGKVKFVKGELLDTRKLKQVIDGIDTVYHMAARVTTPLSNESSHLFEQVNNWGTAELVYAVEESQVKKFIYTSSASVYGTSDEEIDINTTPNPKSFYGISKLRGEQHVERLMKKMDTFIIRSANIYGCGTSLRFDAVINNFMFEACYNGKISIHGDGNQRRSFIQIKNAVSVLNELKNTTLQPGKYNLVDRVMSINEIAATLMEIMPEAEMVFINQHMRMKDLMVKGIHQVKLAKIFLSSLE